MFYWQIFPLCILTSSLKCMCIWESGGKDTLTAKGSPCAPTSTPEEALVRACTKLLLRALSLRMLFWCVIELNWIQCITPSGITLVSALWGISSQMWTRVRPSGPWPKETRFPGGRGVPWKHMPAVDAKRCKRNMSQSPLSWGDKGWALTFMGVWAGDKDFPWMKWEKCLSKGDTPSRGQILKLRAHRKVGRWSWERQELGLQTQMALCTWQRNRQVLLLCICSFLWSPLKSDNNQSSILLFELTTLGKNNKENYEKFLSPWILFLTLNIHGRSDLVRGRCCSTVD